MNLSSIFFSTVRMKIPRSFFMSSRDPLFLNMVVMFARVTNRGIIWLVLTPLNSDNNASFRSSPIQPVLNSLLTIPLGSAVLLFFMLFNTTSRLSMSQAGDTFVTRVFSLDSQSSFLRKKISRYFGAIFLCLSLFFIGVEI